MRYLSNAFSLQMVSPGDTIYTREITIDAARNFARAAKSIIGHADTARVVSEMLGAEVDHNRESITLSHGDRLVVAQITGGRLPEGATTLPETCEITFLQVDIEGKTLPYTTPYGAGSIFGAIRSRANQIAEKVDGTVSDVQDPAGNFLCEINGPGFHGTVWDD